MSQVLSNAGIRGSPSARRAASALSPIRSSPPAGHTPSTASWARASFPNSNPSLALRWSESRDGEKRQEDVRWTAVSGCTSQDRDRVLAGRADGRRRDRRIGLGPGQRRRDERRLSAQASRRGPRGACEDPTPAAKRDRSLSVPVVCVGLGGGGRCLGATRRRARPGAALDRSGRPLRRAGVPRGLCRALLRVPARPPPVGRRHHHGGGAGRHRADLGAGRRRSARLRPGGPDRDRVRRACGRYHDRRHVQPPSRARRCTRSPAWESPREPSLASPISRSSSLPTTLPAGYSS